MRHDSPQSRRRRFGQNFLIDRAMAGALVRRFDPGPAERVVEIGPGRGALTTMLAERAGHFVAIELDETLVPELSRAVEPFERASIRHGNGLTVDWDALGEELGGPLRVIGNLPYNVGTAIVRRLLASDAIADMQVVLQRETAQRILASPGGKEYGPLSVIAALRSTGRKVLALPPQLFRPRPKVHSWAIQLQRREMPRITVAEITSLERWLFRGFAQRRKTLAGNLKQHQETVRRMLADAGLPEDARAERVPPELWLEIYRALDT